MLSPDIYNNRVQGVEFKTLASNPLPILRESHYCTLHMYYCPVIISEYRLALHAMHGFYGGPAASETLVGGYICIIGGCSTLQKQPRENTGGSG